MAKKKTETTFREMLDAAGEKVCERRGALADTEFFSETIWESFSCCYRMAMARDFYDGFGRDLATVFANNGYIPSADQTAFWARWPRSTFVNLGYQSFPNRSALKLRSCS